MYFFPCPKVATVCCKIHETLRGGKTPVKLDLICGLDKLDVARLLIIGCMKMETVSGERLKARGINMKQLHGNEQLDIWSVRERLNWFHYNCWCRQILCLECPSCVRCLNKRAPEKVVSSEILRIRTSSCHLLALKAVSSGSCCRDQP